MTRKCYKCRRIKDLTEFYKHKNQPLGRMYECKSCRKKYKKRWYRQNLEKSQLNTKLYRQRNKDNMYEIDKRNHLKTKYNLTLEQYKNLLILQNYVCKICKKPETVIKSKKRAVLSVDHNHQTKEIRGLLCNNCNRALGLFKDDVVLLQGAINYIKEYSNNV